MQNQGWWPPPLYLSCGRTLQRATPLLPWCWPEGCGTSGVDAILWAKRMRPVLVSTLATLPGGKWHFVVSELVTCRGGRWGSQRLCLACKLSHESWHFGVISWVVLGWDFWLGRCCSWFWTGKMTLGNPSQAAAHWACLVELYIDFSLCGPC